MMTYEAVEHTVTMAAGKSPFIQLGGGMALGAIYVPAPAGIVTFEMADKLGNYSPIQNLEGVDTAAGAGWYAVPPACFSTADRIKLVAAGIDGQEVLLRTGRFQ